MAGEEILVAPYTAWWAPVGTAFPAVNSPPGAPWALIGTQGEGSLAAPVVVTLGQTVQQFRGQTGEIREAWRTESDLTIAFSVADLTPEMLRVAVDLHAVTTAAGPPATKTIGLAMQRGKVERLALLIRGISPVGTGTTAQYQVPIAYSESAPAITHGKDEPAQIAYTFRAIADPSAATPEARYGTYVLQTA